LVYYQYASPSGDHTAIKDKNYFNYTNPSEMKYISKYGGDGPIGGHGLSGSWYHLVAQNNPNFNVSSPEFWAYIPGIFPNQTTTLSSGNTKVFTVPNKSGLTYNWTLSNGSASIQGSTTSNSVTVRGDYGGSVTLNCKITSSVDAKVSNFSVNINVTSTYITGTYTTTSVNNAYLNTANFVSPGNIQATAQCGSAINAVTWTKTSGSPIVTQSGNTVYFNMPSGSSVNFNISSYCGGSGFTSRTVTFYHFGSFLTYPNPSSDELTLDTGIDLEFTAELVSERSLRKIRQHSFTEKWQIDVNGLEKGNYIVRLFYEEQLLRTQRIVIK